MPEPEACGNDLDEAEIACGSLVVSGGETPGIFQTVDAALDAVAQGIDQTVDRLGTRSVAAGRNDRRATLRGDLLADGVGVVALVGDQHLWLGQVGVCQGVIAGIVGDLARAEGDLHR